MLPEIFWGEAKSGRSNPSFLSPWYRVDVQLTDIVEPMVGFGLFAYCSGPGYPCLFMRRKMLTPARTGWDASESYQK